MAKPNVKSSSHAPVVERLREVRASASLPRLETFDGEEHRGFPRIPMKVRFEVTRGDPKSPSFSAVLPSENVSVSGAFLASTFFLPVGTELQVSFAIDPASEPVRARAVLMRHQQGGNETSGFGVHFVEFYGQTEIALARVFLDVRLTAFAEEYLASRRAKSFKTEIERVIDALAAWELLKVTTQDDIWGLIKNRAQDR